MSILSWIRMISLSRSGTIGQDEVERTTITISLVVLKANECMKHSAPLKHHSCRGKHKILGAFWLDECWFRKSDRGKDDHNSDPLGHSRVKKLIDSLQLDHLLFAEAEQGDVHEALGKSELAAQISQPFCHLCKLHAGCHL